MYKCRKQYLLSFPCWRTCLCCVPPHFWNQIYVLDWKYPLSSQFKFTIKMLPLWCTNMTHIQYILNLKSFTDCSNKYLLPVCDYALCEAPSLEAVVRFSRSGCCRSGFVAVLEWGPRLWGYRVFLMWHLSTSRECHSSYICELISIEWSDRFFYFQTHPLHLNGNVSVALQREN